MRLALALLFPVLAACSASSAASHGSGADAAADATAGDASSIDGAAADGSSNGADASDSSAPCPTPNAVDAAYAELTVLGDDGSTGGIFDPSIVYAADAGAGFMTYSSVAGQGGVHTRIATSTDHGATWTYVADVDDTSPATITTSDTTVCDAGTCSGTWVHEVSSLVVDDGDAADPEGSRAYQVLAHTYFWNGALHYEIGDIDLFTAPAPAGPWTRTELFGWPSSASDSSDGVTENIATDPRLAGLAGCAIVTEPGALVTASSTELALGCVRADGTITVVLLRSTDHARSFAYVSTLLSAADATLLGAAHAQMNGADLFTLGGVPYLVASPDGPVTVGASTADGYTGCLVFPFADEAAGTLARCDGGPLVVASYLRAERRFAGGCTVAEGATAAGVVVPIADLSSAVPFHVFTTGSFF